LFRACQVPYRKYLRNQFMVSFDAYLEICRRVNQKLDDALGYDSSNAYSVFVLPASTVFQEKKNRNFLFFYLSMAITHSNVSVPPSVERKNYLIQDQYDQTDG
jgi:hypothetical protein